MNDRLIDASLTESLLALLPHPVALQINILRQDESYRFGNLHDLLIIPLRNVFHQLGCRSLDREGVFQDTIAALLFEMRSQNISSYEELQEFLGLEAVLQCGLQQVRSHVI